MGWGSGRSSSMGLPWARCLGSYPCGESRGRGGSGQVRRRRPRDHGRRLLEGRAKLAVTPGEARAEEAGEIRARRRPLAAEVGHEDVAGLVEVAERPTG